jgi:hypothetical protein
MIKYILLALFVAGCSLSDDCEVGDIRCDGSSLQVCGSENDWLESMNCSSIEPIEFDWVCCINQKGCVPKAECK